MTLTTSAQSSAELVGRAREVMPVLRSHALWGEENRRLHDEVVEALTAAGICRMRVPARYGGHEADATTMFETVTELARGDGSASWNSGVWSIGAWLTGMFPDQVQEEVFGTADVRICGVLSTTAQATPRDGGVVIDGAWKFVSGAWHSQWQVVVAMAPTPDGAGLWPVMAVVPMSDLEILDDWHTAGLRGSGSVSTVARDVFVPAERVLPIVTILGGPPASAINAESAMFQAPMLANASASVTGTAVGLAKAALETFLERMPDRKITYTDYTSQRDAPITHLQVGEAALTIDEAQFHATRLATTIDSRGISREPWTVHDRVGARVALGRALRLAKNAADILSTGSGASSLYSSVPIQRIDRDIRALNMHALMHPNTNLELYGRILCGLEPNTTYY
jgi:alkylation response protein AidB-like acyl-CoA dehydrogenase